MRRFTNWEQLSTELAFSSRGVTWSVAVDRNFQSVVRVNPVSELPGASIGKIFILMATLQQVDRGILSLDQVVDISEGEPLTDSGLIQYLSATSYSVSDLCVLVASVSDNRAANALMNLVGFASTQQVSRDLGFVHTHVLDRIRDIRLPGQPEAPSFASAGELLTLVNMITTNDPRITGAKQLRHWLSLNTDTSMVASSFFCDPLAHALTNEHESGEHSTLWNKTGTDTTVRADCGSVTRNGDTWTYAAIAHWKEADSQTAALVMQDMQSLGAFMATST